MEPVEINWPTYSANESIVVAVGVDSASQITFETSTAYPEKWAAEKNHLMIARARGQQVAFAMSQEELVKMINKLMEIAVFTDEFEGPSPF